MSDSIRPLSTHHAQPSSLIYLEQVLTALPGIEEALNCLIREPNNRQALEEGYRYTATVGSIASKIEALTLAHLAHGMEGMLGDVLDGYLYLDPPTLALLQESLGQIRLLAQHLAGNGQDDRSGAPPLRSRQVVESTLDASRSGETSRMRWFRGFEGENTARVGNHAEWQPATTRAHQLEHADRLQHTLASAGMQNAKSAVALLQQFQQQRQTGLIRMWRGEGTMVEEGMIRLVKGQITEANVGRWHGPEARNRIRQWGTCRFTFEQSPDR